MKAYEGYSDKELWNLVRVNDREAFEAIYRRHWSSLLVSAYYVLEDREVCRDIVLDCGIHHPYSIHFLPTKILIDPDGVIVAGTARKRLS